MAKVPVHFRRAAEIGKTAVENNLLVQIQKPVCVLSDVRGVMGYQDDCYAFLAFPLFSFFLY